MLRTLQVTGVFPRIPAARSKDTEYPWRPWLQIPFTESSQVEVIRGDRVMLLLIEFGIMEVQHVVKRMYC
jgi:hypothetical protein